MSHNLSHDHLYVTLQTDTQNDGDPLIFTADNRFPIIDQPDNMVVAVRSFGIPRVSQPLFFFEEDPADPFNTFYWVSIGAVDVRVNYISYGTSPLGPLGVYFVDQYMEMLNAALLTAHIANAITGPPPQFAFESDTRVSLYIPVGYPALVYCSDAVLDKFPGIPVAYNPAGYPKTYQFKTIATLNNGVTVAGVPYLRMSQDFPTAQYTLDTFRSIIFVNESLPIPDTLYSESNLATNLNVLHVFDLTTQQETSNIWGSFSYNSEGLYIWNDLTSKTPLTNLRIGVYYLDSKGKIQRLRMYRKDRSTVTLTFKKNDVVM
jgi:hypothetical protein